MIEAVIGNPLQTYDVIGNFTDRGSGCDRDRVIGHCDRLRDRRAAKFTPSHMLRR